MRAITFDCDDPQRLSTFWANVLECDVDPHQLDGFATIGYVEKTQPFLVFQKVEGGKVGTNRVHADIASKNYECERVLALGATRIRDVAENGIRFTTFAGPEGNQFDLSDE